jgi:hypothetical protein
LKCSRSNTCNTARPAAAATALPPKVEKNPHLAWNSSIYRAARDHDPERKAVADRLAEGHDVRRKPAALETPEMRAGAAQTILDLVSDDQRSGIRARAVISREPGGRRIEDAVAGQAVSI